MILYQKEDMMIMGVVVVGGTNDINDTRWLFCMGFYLYYERGTTPRWLSCYDIFLITFVPCDRGTMRAHKRTNGEWELTRE